MEDYEISEKASILFLSLQYHIAYPLYIKSRIDDVYKLRKHRNKILLLLCDCKDE